jgi:hypothetical protein
MMMGKCCRHNNNQPKTSHSPDRFYIINSFVRENTSFPYTNPPRDNGGQCHHQQAVANISSASAQNMVLASSAGATGNLPATDSVTALEKGHRTFVRCRLAASFKKDG